MGISERDRAVRDLMLSSGGHFRASPGLVTAFLGVVILSKNDDGGFISLLGLTLVMLSSLSYAIYLVYINRGPMKKINTSTITFYVILGGFLVMIPYCLLDGGLMLPKTTPAWINAIGLGFSLPLSLSSSPLVP